MSFSELPARPIEGLEPYQVLLDRSYVAAPLPEKLHRIYGGGLTLAGPIVYANFVQSLDGVVALGDVPSAGSVISGRNDGDRFLMGLLRALADAVMIGAGTLRGSPGHQWTPEHVFPDMAGEFAALRGDQGRSATPRLVVLTSAGDIDGRHPGLEDGALIVTTSEGAARMKGKLPEACDVVPASDGGLIDVRRAVQLLRDRGLQVILTEGGPQLMGHLVAGGQLDEVFLTLAPVIAGGGQDDGRPGMVQGIRFLPDDGRWARLLSARSNGSHLFLRYRLEAGV
jgi:riboflavin biosynthesis pyrimidine reductase